VRLAEVCLHHPFVSRAADGTLDPEAFRRYVAQERVLPQRVRSGLRTRCRPQPGREDAHLALRPVEWVLRELQLHTGYAKELKIELARVQPYRQ